MVDLKEILKLSVPERIEMVEAIWDSIAESSHGDNNPLTDEQEKEIERRIERHENGDGKTLSWDELKAKLMSGS